MGTVSTAPSARDAPGLDFQMSMRSPQMDRMASEPVLAGHERLAAIAGSANRRDPCPRNTAHLRPRSMLGDAAHLSNGKKSTRASVRAECCTKNSPFSGNLPARATFTCMPLQRRESLFSSGWIIGPRFPNCEEIAERVFGRIKFLARLKTYQESLPQDGRIDKADIRTINDIRVRLIQRSPAKRLCCGSLPKPRF